MDTCIVHCAQNNRGLGANIAIMGYGAKSPDAYAADLGKMSPAALRGNNNRMHTLAWNSTGSHLACGSIDKIVRIWSLHRIEKNDAATEMKGHSGSVDQLVFHPSDPNRIATASVDKTCRIWDIRSGKCIQTVATDGQNINVNWSPDGSCIAVGNKEDVVSFIDTKTMKTFKKTNFSYEINEMVWNLKSDRLFFTNGRNSNGEIEVHTYPELKPVTRIPAHMSNCTCIAMSPSGKCFATGGTDALVCLWDEEELACLRTWGDCDWPVRSLSFSYNGDLIAAVSEDHFVGIFHVDSADIVTKIPSELGAMNSVAWHPTKLLLAAAGESASRRTERDEVPVRVFGDNGDGSIRSRS